MTHDPFAVSDYPLNALPEVRDTRRTDFETEDFGPIWIEYMGGFDAASHFVRSLYEPKGKRGGTQVFGDLKPGIRKVELRVDNFESVRESFQTRYVVPAASGRDDAERNLALATVIDVNSGMLNEHLMRALPIALDVKSRWHKRAEAISQATYFGELAIEGMEGEKALARVAASIFGGSGKTGLRKKRDLDTVREIARVRAEHLRYAPKPDIGIDAEKVREGVRSGKIRRYPHAADSWFAENQQDRVAQSIIDALRGHAPGKKWGDLRWDVLNLIEGFDRRGLPLSGPAQVALDYALELVDKNGKPIQHRKPMRGVKGDAPPYMAIPLGGIAKRGEFMKWASVKAGVVEEDDIEFDRPKDEVLAEWELSSLFNTAVRALKRR